MATSDRPSEPANLQASETRARITVQRRGTLALNPAAFKKLGSPAAVELLFDANQQIVGVRASAATAADAYPVRSVGTPATRYLIAGAAFTRFHGIATDKERSWYAALQNGVLCINLAKADNKPRRDRRGKLPASLDPP